jgi:hypothetical protein
MARLCARVFGIVAIVIALSTSPVLAIGPGGGTGGGGGGGSGGGGGGGNVPEINPNAAVAALTLLGGMTLILTDRMRRKRLAAQA